jgi:hypothetical protein
MKYFLSKAKKLGPILFQLKTSAQKIRQENPYPRRAFWGCFPQNASETAALFFESRWRI